MTSAQEGRKEGYDIIGGRGEDSNGHRANDVMKMAIGGQFWKGFTLASSLPHSSPSLHLHSLSGLRDGFMSDGRTARKDDDLWRGGRKHFHTHREGWRQSEEHGREGERAVAAPIYPSRPNWFLMCGFLLPTDRLTGDDGVE